MSPLYPFILPVPPEARSLPPRERNAILSARARDALALSAARSGVTLERLEKTPEGAPIPVNGAYWSLAHKPRYVAGVAAPEDIGIDIEEIREVHAGLYDKIATASEKVLIDDTPRSLFRIWTAKEAVLKAGAAGLRDLSRCRLLAVPDEHRMTLSYRDREITVEHVYFDGHIASVTTADRRVQWCFEEGATEPTRRYSWT